MSLNYLKIHVKEIIFVLYLHLDFELHNHINIKRLNFNRRQHQTILIGLLILVFGLISICFVSSYVREHFKLVKTKSKKRVSKIRVSLPYGEDTLIAIRGEKRIAQVTIYQVAASL